MTTNTKRGRRKMVKGQREEKKKTAKGNWEQRES